MVSVGGVGEWGAAAVGQSVGVVAAVIIGYGWAISGPAIIAKSAHGDYITVLKESIYTRLVLLGPTTLVAAAACLFLIPNGRNLYTILGLLSTALLGLRFNWFLIGLGRPYVMLLTETLPRVAATLLGLVLMNMTSSMAVALIAQVIGLVLSALVSAFWAVTYVRRYAALPHEAVPPIKQSILTHRFGMSAAIVSAFYSSGPLILIGFTSPASVGTYAVLDRIIKQLFTAASPLIDALRGWVPRHDSSVQRRRAKMALAATAMGSGFAALLIVLVGAEVVKWFSDSQVEPDFWTMTCFGLFFAASLFSMVLGQVVLISFGLVRNLFYTSVLTATSGLLLAAVLSTFWGVPGVLISLVCGHALGILRNLRTLQSHLRE
ncbi:hypothetical protein [Arthrobacter sp. MAHUQ-56]